MLLHFDRNGHALRVDIDRRKLFTFDSKRIEVTEYLRWYWLSDGLDTGEKKNAV
jgi:hypothetical protein